MARIQLPIEEFGSYYKGQEPIFFARTEGDHTTKTCRVDGLVRGNGWLFCQYLEDTCEVMLCYREPGLSHGRPLEIIKLQTEKHPEGHEKAGDYVPLHFTRVPQYVLLNTDWRGGNSFRYSLVLMAKCSLFHKNDDIRVLHADETMHKMTTRPFMLKFRKFYNPFKDVEHPLFLCLCEPEEGEECPIAQCKIADATVNPEFFTIYSSEGDGAASGAKRKVKCLLDDLSAAEKESLNCFLPYLPTHKKIILPCNCAFAAMPLILRLLTQKRESSAMRSCPTCKKHFYNIKIDFEHIPSHFPSSIRELLFEIGVDNP